MKLSFSLKKLYGIISFFLVLDIFLVPFITEPFVFKDGIFEEYILGTIIAILVWSYFLWLNFVDLSKAAIHRFENSIPFSKIYSNEDKRRYYIHLVFAMRLITVVLSILILLGIFSVVIQYELLLINFRTFLN
jgi:hypothetical protein